jgi:seryl-tRNA synthetase
LEYARKGEITSAYDLALIIIDEASRVFFDRTKTNDRQPNMMEMFADAIRGVVSALTMMLLTRTLTWNHQTYKQTAAFDQFLIYTNLASREYKRQHNADTATQNHLLNINAEGNLLKEVKDIMDEIHIITRIKEQQQMVMESFAKQVRRAMQPDLPIDTSGDTSEEARRRCEAARLTVTRSDNLLRDIRDRIDELNTLLENAAKTSASVGTSKA